jgi:hypothetical protein
VTCIGRQAEANVWQAPPGSLISTGWKNQRDTRINRTIKSFVQQIRGGYFLLASAFRVIIVCLSGIHHGGVGMKYYGTVADRLSIGSASNDERQEYYKYSGHPSIIRRPYLNTKKSLE